MFKPELGHCKDVTKFYLKERAIPMFNRPRPTAIAMKLKREEELNHQKKLGVIEKVNTAEWSALVVPVVKPTGAIQLCGDYKVSVNPYLEVNKYLTPHTEEIFTALNGGEKFTKLKHIYRYSWKKNQRTWWVINTYKGLYHFTLLPYGVESAPSIFQQIMHHILPK